jgi:hypothetical protein
MQTDEAPQASIGKETKALAKSKVQPESERIENALEREPNSKDPFPVHTDRLGLCVLIDSRSPSRNISGSPSLDGGAPRERLA